MINRMALAAALFAAGLISLESKADTVTLTFEGTGDDQSIGNLYAAYGITFSSASHGLIDRDSDGVSFGNFANEPSTNTVMYYYNPTTTVSAVMDVAAGFTGSLSFYYSQNGTGATVGIYDGLDGSGNLLNSIGLASQYNANNCHGDPTGAYCNWSYISLNFDGIGQSVVFSGNAGRVLFDDVTLQTSVPEPASWAMALSGLALVGVAMRRRRIPGLLSVQ